MGPLFSTLLVLSSIAGATADEKGFYIETPYISQAKNYCGPAVLAMVFRYWGRSADQRDLASRFQPFPKKGLSGSELKQLAKTSGFSTYSFSGRPETVRAHLAEGRPLIVALRSSAFRDINHFVVLVGWDPQKQEWIIQDPAVGPYRRYSAKEFANSWGALNNWTLLVVPDRSNL